MKLFVDWTDGKRLVIQQDAVPVFSPEAQAMLDN